MAIKFKITGDGSQLKGEVQKSNKQVVKLRQNVETPMVMQADATPVINQVEKVEQTVKKEKNRHGGNSNGKYVKRTRRHNRDMDDTSAAQQFALDVRGSKFQGVDAFTSKIARMITKVGGSFITLQTAVLTGIFLIMMGAQKLYKVLFNSAQKQLKNNELITKSLQKKNQKLEEEKKQISEIIDQMKKLNDSTDTFNETQEAINLALVTKLKDKWADVVVQIDNATGKIKNLQEIQGQLAFKTFEEQSQNLEEMAKVSRNTLDLYLSDLTHSNSFMGLELGNNFNQHLLDFFQGGNLTPELRDMFTKLQAHLTSKWKDQIDSNLLYSTNRQDQIKFFRQLYVANTDSGEKEKIKKIIDELQRLAQIQKKRDVLGNPSDTIARREQDLQKKDKDLQTKYAETQGKIADNIAKRQEQFDEAELAKMSAEDRAKELRSRAEALTKEAQQYKEELAGYRKQLNEAGMSYDKNGNLTTDSMNDFLKNNKEIIDLYNKRQEAEKILRDDTQLILNYKKAYREWSDDKNNANLKKAMDDAAEAIKNGSTGKLGWGSYDAVRYATEDIANIDQQINQRLNKDTQAQYAEEIKKREGINEILDKQKTAAQNLTATFDKLDKTVTGAEAAEDEAKKAKEKETAERKAQMDKQNGFFKSYLKKATDKYYDKVGPSKDYIRKQLEEQYRNLLPQKDKERRLTKAEQRGLDAMAEKEYRDKIKDEMTNDKVTTKITNELARKGGFSSSIYVEGRDNILNRNLKVNTDSLEQLKAIRQLETRIAAIEFENRLIH